MKKNNNKYMPKTPKEKGLMVGAIICVVVFIPCLISTLYSTTLSRGVMDNHLMAMDKHMDERHRSTPTCLSTAMAKEADKRW